jgi:hypothetical protein
MALFTADSRFIAFTDATAAEPAQQPNGREPLAAVSDNLSTYLWASMSGHPADAQT